MAAEEEREATLSDKSKHRRFTDILFSQKQSNMFCDVVLKVCSSEIYAHSNVLAAASPYFEHFLSQDLPRLFSQRSPQIIEIQIDGNEPNVYYEEAVDRVIDFIYTGNLTVKECNVAQIYEISKIMDMNNIISFCEDFIQGKVQHDTIYHASDGSQYRSVTSNTEITSIKYGSMLDFWSAISKSTRTEKDAALLSKIKSRKVTSVACQTVPVLEENQTKCTADNAQTDSGFVALDIKTYFPRKRGRPVKAKNTAVGLSSDEISPKRAKTADSGDNKAKENTENQVEEEELRKVITTRSGRKVIQKFNPADSTQPAKKIKEEDIDSGDEIEQSTTVDEKSNMKLDRPALESIESNLETELNYGEDSVKYNVEEDPGILSLDIPTGESQNSDKEGDQSFSEDSQAVHVVISKATEDSQQSHTAVILNDFQPLERIDQVDFTSKKKRRLAKKYVCNECEFETVSVRDMTSHTMEHKLEKNECFYCDMFIEDRDDLMTHVQGHTGPTPFQCLKCSSKFKTRTMMNLHLPKHSDEKPYICEVCSMGFKWKHALTTHMNTHSNKKEHLCDICGYTTAWKSQLKAHKLIHLGKTFKCERPGCTFETIKKQNLKYHEVTHTGDRKNVCEICGQTFSLKRNMRRHMLLHFSAKQHRCFDCEFASTRYDKLKEHMLKQHGKGTPPERRLKISDISKKHNLTIQPTGQFVPAPDKVVTMWEDEHNTDPNLLLAAGDVTGAESAVIQQSTNSEEAGLTTVTQGGDVIVIKNQEADTYAILNNIINAASGKSVIIQSEDGQRLSGLQEFTAQQVEGEDETSIQQLVNDHQQLAEEQQTYQIISQDAIQFTDSASLAEQTIQVIDGQNKMQLIKVQDLATGINLPEGLNFTGQPIQIVHEPAQTANKSTVVTSQPQPDLSVPPSYDQIVIEPYSVAEAVGTSKEPLLSMGENDSIVSHTDQVVIQGPGGAHVPVQIVKPI